MKMSLDFGCVGFWLIQSCFEFIKFEVLNPPPGHQRRVVLPRGVGDKVEDVRIAGVLKDEAVEAALLERVKVALERYH